MLKGASAVLPSYLSRYESRFQFISGRYARVLHLYRTVIVVPNDGIRADPI